MRKKVFLILPILFIINSYGLANEIKFTVVTKEPIGFKEKNEFYQLGTPINVFLRKFGPAEKVTEDKYEGERIRLFTRDEYNQHYLANTRTHYYVNDGLMVTEDGSGIIKAIIFYLVPDGDLKAARVKTDTGISVGYSVRQIMELYGEPFKKKEFKGTILGHTFEQVELYYKYGQNVIGYNFDHGILKSISLNAGYLKYLEELP